MKQFVKRALESFGLEINRKGGGDAVICADTDFMRIYEACRSYTMTDLSAAYALHNMVKYTVQKDLPGAFVECGVWRGGSSMIIAKTLQSMGVERDVMLFDTFEGMSEPTDDDKLVGDTTYDVRERWETDQHSAAHNEWCYASIEDVTENLRRTGYPQAHIHFVKGKVEDTLPQNAPEQIALLRLDTDWYESTRHELEHLYPRLAQGGLLIIDDYGAWDGAKKATDEYFSDTPVLLHRVNNSVRAMHKV